MQPAASIEFGAHLSCAILSFVEDLCCRSNAVQVYLLLVPHVCMLIYLYLLLLSVWDSWAVGVLLPATSATE